MQVPWCGKNSCTVRATPAPAWSIRDSTSIPRAKAASSAARISAELTIGESNQSSDFFFRLFFFLGRSSSSSLLLFFFRLDVWWVTLEDFRCFEYFDLRLERSRTASARTKSRLAPAVRKGCGP